ncbi:putative receptor-like protein kinase At3g47110 [Cryptomeria japonica]|uniref:putative receptor-like protein kinase At3g47110 n=1 Tax=Cryptomeria japonica TaxID=3369 RepID=UPI0025ACE565|nr:putative receptor-like protein kinase At3g47110 [Cryptomeria japonica]
MVMVLAIDVSQNNLLGAIPSALASCKGLEYLNLPSNAFEGPILTSLADLSNLQFMDLSRNNLSGMIPVTFTKMKMLRHLNLSSNRLTGEVPKGGVFTTLDASEIMGNIGPLWWMDKLATMLSFRSQTTISLQKDFGISNIIFDNSIDSLASTKALKGSVGYVAPEYGIGGKLTTKGDVYSYGVFILELLTRRRPTDDMFIEGINLQKWTKMHFPNRISDVVDNFVLIDAHESEKSMIIECLTQIIEIGLFCTRESPQERPDMTGIVDRLNIIRGVFLGTPITQLPIDFSPFLDNTRGINVDGSGNDEGSFTSTS